MNYYGSIDLSKIPGARRQVVDGEECLVIPLDSSRSLYVGRRQVNADLDVRVSPQNGYGQSHFIRLYVARKDQRSSMNAYQLRAATPIIGFLKEKRYFGDKSEVTPVSATRAPAVYSGSPAEFDNPEFSPG